MKSIHLIAVNYHSYGLVERFLRSADAAAARCKDFRVTVTIADNDAQELWQAPELEHIECNVEAIKENVGYLGAAQRIWNKDGNNISEEYDYVCISNVDLELAPDFFEVLYNYETPHNCGWIVPDIFTPAAHSHENPFMATRPTRTNFIIWKIIYSSMTVYRLYNHLSAWRKRNARRVDKGCVIYAGHGSFMLFTSFFAKQNPEINFPGFMYGEELFFAELVRRCGAITVYAPELRISNVGKVSTGAVSQQIKSAWSLSSLKAIERLWF